MTTTENGSKAAPSTQDTLTTTQTPPTSSNDPPKSPPTNERGEVTMVKSGQHTYTKITMVRNENFRISPTSAFTPTRKDPEDLCDVKPKRLKEDPSLKHLKGPSNGSKAPLMRSSSMPVQSYSPGKNII